MEKSAVSPVPAVFSFESLDVRVVDRDGIPWFIAADVCSSLTIEKHRDAVSRLDDDERGSVLVDTLGGRQEMAAVNESGLYSLIMTSRKPEAKRFKKWVTSEVLPAIRKTGGYSSVPVIPTDPMAILKLMFDAQTQTNLQVAAVEAKVQTIVDSVRLHQWQCYELKAAATQKAQEFRDTYKCTYSLLFPGIWGYVKRHFRVSTYSAIPTVKFDEALALVKALAFKDMPDYVRESAGGVK